MAIVYPGGTIVNATFTGDSRTNIVEAIRTQLLNAGWTDVSGAAGDRYMQSALTPQNLQCQVRLYDPGSGNCAKVRFQNVAGTKIGTDHFLLPAVAKTFRIIACRYQFFVLVPTTIANGREFVAGGVPFLESFLNGVITECIWGQGSGTSDSDAAAGQTFRNHNQQGTSTGTNLVNGNLWTMNGNPGASAGTQRFVIERGGDDSNTGTDGRMWHNGEVLKYGARLAWGLTAIADPAYVRGQLWGAVMIDQDYTPDVTATFDGHDWFSITGNSGAACGKGSLWVIIT
jgi:hypothetical protein